MSTVSELVEVRKYDVPSLFTNKLGEVPIPYITAGMKIHYMMKSTEAENSLNTEALQFQGEETIFSQKTK